MIQVSVRCDAYIHRRMRGLEINPTMVAYHEAKLELKMPGFEALLGRQKYMAGDVSHPIQSFHRLGSTCLLP
jgi:hypothetical protein